MSAISRDIEVLLKLARAEAFEDAAKMADRWCDQNKDSAARARKSLSGGSSSMAEMLDGAAIECNALAMAIRSMS